MHGRVIELLTQWNFTIQPVSNGTEGVALSFNKKARQLNYVHELDKKGLALSSICSFKMLSDNQIFLGTCR